ncbi:MAG: Do family serine endopeptidase [Alphaproteobacteria bacterium]|nr:Do family serine endopeptidase [Alphaproteobacteria bacterium]
MSKKFLFIFSFIFLTSPAFAQNGYPSFADLAEKLLPTVVNISTIQQTEKLDTPLADDVDGEEAAALLDTSSESDKRQALGSGFIIDEAGFIITNYHVIENASTINVVLFDNTEVEAEVIGGDEKTDLALIKIDPPYKLQKAIFGNSDELRIGDWVLAIGNPFGLGGSVSAGIVSAKSRDIAAGPYDNFIQTDASINQGSSGGPMFNMKGEVIGINTALFSNTGNSTGVGFAIPINMAGWIAGQLEQTGQVKRGWIGVTIQNNSKETAERLGLKNTQGVIVSAVAEDSPASKAGLLVGDVILNLGQKEINVSKDFSRMVAESPIGKDIQLIVWRSGKIFPLSITVVEMPSATENKADEQSLPSDHIVQQLGIKLAEITPDILKRFNLAPVTLGLVVVSVEANSDAASQGIKKGDVILKMDKKDVLTLDAAEEYIKEAEQENNRPIMLLLQNQEQGTMAAVSIRLKKND